MQVLWACWAPPLETGKLAGFCYAGEFASLSYTSCLVVFIFSTQYLRFVVAVVVCFGVVDFLALFSCSL